MLALPPGVPVPPTLLRRETARAYWSIDIVRYVLADLEGAGGNRAGGATSGQSFFALSV